MPTLWLYNSITIIPALQQYCVEISFIYLFIYVHFCWGKRGIVVFFQRTVPVAWSVFVQGWGFFLFFFFKLWLNEPWTPLNTIWWVNILSYKIKGIKHKEKSAIQNKQSLLETLFKVLELCVKWVTDIISNKFFMLICGTTHGRRHLHMDQAPFHAVACLKLFLYWINTFEPLLKTGRLLFSDGGKKTALRKHAYNIGRVRFVVSRFHLRPSETGC